MKIKNCILAAAFALSSLVLAPGISSAGEHATKIYVAQDTDHGFVLRRGYVVYKGFPVYRTFKAGTRKHRGYYVPNRAFDVNVTITRGAPRHTKPRILTLK